jgi:uracil phosphoribosyltransferase
MGVTVLDHAIARSIVTQLRDKNTPPEIFRALARRISTILAVEAARGLSITPLQVETPLEVTNGHQFTDGLVAVPILRAGLGMLDPVLELIPNTDVGYLGLERNEMTAEAGLYYSKMPNVTGKTVWLLDPMLATGGSACSAARVLYDLGASETTLICIVAAPEGIALLTREYPLLKILTASLDRELNDRKYILPGLGDFGDRLFGTG